MTVKNTSDDDDGDKDGKQYLGEQAAIVWSKCGNKLEKIDLKRREQEAGERRKGVNSVGVTIP